MKKHLLTGKLTAFLFLLACSSLFAQPYIRTSGGLGQYGYIEKDASATNFLVANGGYGNINQYVVKSWNGSSNSYTYTGSGSCSRGDDSTGNYNFGTLTSGQGIYSSVAVQFGGCDSGISYSHGSMTPTATAFNERSFFVMDVAPTTNAVVSSACFTQANSNVVLSFTIANGNTAGQALNRLWLTNDGTATEVTDIKNDAFMLYYEPATGSETFNGNESSAVLYGNYGGNAAGNNEYGHDALNIAIPQNTTGGLRCYVVLRGTSTYLNNSAKTKNVRLGIMADGISITPNRDTNFSKLRMDLTRSSASFITINDIVTPTFTQVAPICSGATLAALPTVSNNSVTGTWSPALDNANTTTYTFTPAIGSCANTTTMTITVNPNVTYYRDADNDTYGDPAVTTISCTGAPAGYVANNTDCNDGNASMHTKYPFYSNTDGDAYGDGELILVCAVDANTAPTGYSTVTGDCDPSDGNAWQMGTLFIDMDGDGYTNGSEEVCYGNPYPPVGYKPSSLGDDCDDTNASIHTNFAFYVDADGDNYGTGAAVQLCAASATVAPAGYATTNTDCNDDPLNGGFNVNPGKAEIFYNGIDDNCDGNIDEGRQITSTVLANRCGTTLTKIYQSVNSEFRIAGVTGYRFRIKNLDNPSEPEQITERLNAHFTFNSLPSYHYATNYSVEVMVQRNNVWLNYYGPVCTVRTPDLPKLAVCGGTVAAAGTAVFTEVLTSVVAYRFEVTNVATQQVIPVNNNRPYFRFSEIPGFTAGGVYSVKVSVKTTGDWSPYGSACVITAPGGAAPEIPTDKLTVASTSEFTAAVYPNPFANDFNLDVVTSQNEKVNVKVYDMMGKLVENRDVNAVDVREQQLGNNYPSGVYNIIVTQGENLKTLRVVKR